MFFVLSLTKGQEIQKDGEKPTTFTYEEALEMLKARDAQWESKLAKADSLINMYKYGEEMYEDNLSELEEQIKLDSLLLLAQRKQIDLLKSRDKANEEMIKLVEKKWYENQYLWLGIGFIFGKRYEIKRYKRSTTTRIY